MKNKAGLLIIGICLFLSTAANSWADENGNDAKAHSPEGYQLEEVYPVMDPDQGTLEQWMWEYENSPRAYIDQGIRKKLSGGGSHSLLSDVTYTPSERYQGACGDCWAWAGSGIVGVALSLQAGINDRESVQHINSCFTSSDPCCGGNLYDIVNFYQDQGYVVPWSNTSAHYQDAGRQCSQGAPISCGAIGNSPNYPVSSIAAESIPANGIAKETAIANIKNVLNQNKAVWFGFFLSDWNSFRSWWQSNGESAVWDPNSACTGTYAGGHAVLCVGYNDVDPNNRYWIMLNSWGTAGGNRPNGVFRVDMDMNYDCAFYYPASGSYYYSFQWMTLDIDFGVTVTSPEMISPSPGSTLASSSATFSWTSGADNYQLYGGSSLGLSDIFDSGDLGSDTSVAVSGLPTDGSVVYVRLFYKYGSSAWEYKDYNYTTQNQVFAPSKPALVAPEGYISETLPQYSWEPVDGAESYYLWVNGPSGVVLTQWYDAEEVNGGTLCSVTPNQELNSGSYAWWVRASNSAGNGPWSSRMDFAVTGGVSVPVKPTLIGPSGSITESSPAFSWQTVAGASWYQFWLNGPSGTVHVKWYRSEEVNAGSTCSLSVTGSLQGGSYSWWVRAWNSVGYGPWSSRMDFTVSSSTSAPSAASLISPSGSISQQRPTFVWEKVESSTWYMLWVNGPSGSIIKQWYTADTVVQGANCEILSPLSLASGNYKWWIRTWNPNGYGPWSSGMTFSVQ